MRSKFGFLKTTRELVYLLWLVTNLVGVFSVNITFGGKIKESPTADLSRYFLPISWRPESTLGEIGLSGRVYDTFVYFERDLGFFCL